MATYIPGITDYIPQIQPFQPDYNFLGNMLQTKQNKYDQAYTEVSSLYGSLLNSPMLREADVKKRDAFFKAIEQDIKKTSTMDLSLEQNVDAAKKIFQPFYEDKNIVNDMVKTKKYYNQLSKAEGLKNCTDPEKCGGQYWEQGVKELNYKAEEFSKTSDEQALGFDMPSFTPYYNWQKDAVKLAKDANLNVSQDINTGQWIVTKKNGELIQGGLYSLFKNTYGNDPRVAANYKTSSYVTRKDYSKNYAMEYGSEEAAEKVYIQNTLNAYNKQFPTVRQTIQDAHDNLNGRNNQLKEKKEAQGGVLLPAEQAILDTITGQIENVSAISKSLDDNHNNVTNEELMDLNALRNKADSANSFLAQNQDFQGMAQTLALKDASISMKSNPFAMVSHQANMNLRNQKTMAGVNHAYSLEKMAAQFKMKMGLEDYKALRKGGLLEQDLSTAKVLDSDPYATANLIKDDPQAAYKRNVLMQAQRTATAKAADSDFVYDLFNHAMSSADNSKGAQVYLRNTFGKNWANIKSKEDMVNALVNNKKSVEEVFDKSLITLDQSTDPNGDYEWAQPFIKQRGVEISKIKEQNEASLALINFTSRNNKFVVEKIKASGGVKGQEVNKDADLILTENGFLNADDEPSPEFLYKYIARNHPGAIKRLPNGKTDVSTSVLNEALQAYGALKDKFYDEYNRTPGMSFDQGAGLSGSGTTTAYPVQYSDVAAANYTSPNRKRALNILQDLTAAPGFDVVIGAPTPESLEKGSVEALKPVFDQIRADILYAPTKKDKNLIFDFVERPIAAGNADKSAVTFNLKADYIKKLVGTEKAPGVAYGLGPALMEGISAVYDNKSISTPTTRSVQHTALEEIIKTKGKVYDSFPDAGKVDLTYDRNAGNYILDFNSKVFQNGKYVNSRNRQTVPSDGVDLQTLNNNIINILNQAQKKNMSSSDLWVKQQQEQKS